MIESEPIYINKNSANNIELQNAVDLLVKENTKLKQDLAFWKPSVTIEVHDDNIISSIKHCDKALSSAINKELLFSNVSPEEIAKIIAGNFSEVFKEFIQIDIAKKINLIYNNEKTLRSKGIS